MSGETSVIKAVRIRLANDTRRTASDFGVLKITVSTTASEVPLAQEWNGRWAKFLFLGVSGDRCDIAFSKTSGRTIDATVSSTATGASSGVGSPLQHGISEQRQIPYFEKEERGFLLIDATASGTLWVELADGI